MNGKKLINKLKTSINVCYLIDVKPEKFTGGGQVHLANLVRQMQIQNSDVRPESSVPREFRIQNYIFGGPSSYTVIRFLWSLWVIPRVAFFHFFRRRLVLIHAHSIPAMVAGKLLSLILGIPIVVTVHGAWMSSWLEKFVLTRIKYDAQITVSRDFLKFPNVNKNVCYIPNGVDFEIFKGSALTSQGRALSNKTVLFVGRKNDPVKGFNILERAMRLVKQEIPDVKLLVADGLIPKDVVLKMYQLADLFVLPSLSEGFPLTLLEAWAAKLPVVATKVGELPYLIKDGINGYLVEPGSMDKLATAIVAALNNKHLAKLGQNGYNLAKRYTWSSVARNTMKVYNEAVLNKMS